MKVFMGLIIFICLAFPVFSQSQNSENPDLERFNALSESMDNSVTRSTAMLEDYNSRLDENGSLRMYSSFKKRYDDLIGAIRESELRMALLFRTADRSEYIKKERDVYDNLLTELQSVKGEYDSWLRTVQ